MECPHLIKNGVQLDLITNLLANFTSECIQCSVCNAKESVWICVITGALNCGRYIKAHGLAHYEKTGHSVCMDCHELSVFCYACDDFIFNDTPDSKLDSLRALLVQIQQKQPAIVSSTIINNDSTEEIPKADAEPTLAAKNSENGNDTKSENGRRSSLRQRSSARSRSMDSINGGVENQPPNKKSRKSIGGTNDSKRSGFKSPAINNIRKTKGLKNLVGLRNLGNTCFMSAVIQSLGNINEFCRVLKELPSFNEVSQSSNGSTNVNSKSKTGLNSTPTTPIDKSKDSRHKNGVTPNSSEG